ncbi:MAG: hypothetical protein VX730_08915 [Pseudomonadota bacterium]|nr:hypothetical protein [Pseudomonadota bacterium]
MRRINLKAYFAALVLGVTLLCATPSIADIEHYEFSKEDNGEITLTGIFRDNDNFYDAIVSQLKTGELLEVMLTIDVRPQGWWSKTKSYFTKRRHTVHKRLSLDLLTDEVSLHRNETYTTILPLKDLMPSILSFSNVTIIHPEDVEKGETYLVDVELSFHRGTFEEGDVWQKISHLPRYAMRYIPESLLNPTLGTSLSYKYK